MKYISFQIFSVLNWLVVFTCTIICIYLLVNSETVPRKKTPKSARTSKQQAGLEKCDAEKPKECANRTFENGEYVILPNGTVFVPAYDLRVDECSYVLLDNKIVVCKDENSKTLSFPCGVQLALWISVFSALLPLFFSMLTEDVRDLIHVNWRGLIMSVFFFHFLLQTVNLDKVSEFPEFRYTFPSLMHFFTLVLLSWMTILSHDGMMVSESAAHHNPTYMELMKNFRGHVLSIFTTILFLLGTTFLTEFVEIVPSTFKPESGDFCWLTQRSLMLYFTGPVVTFNVVNFVAFISTYCYLNRQGASCFDGPLLVVKKNYLVHFKLFVMVDITWLVGVLIFLSEIDWLWKVYVVAFIVEETFIVVVPFNKHLEKWVLDKLAGC